MSRPPILRLTSDEIIVDSFAGGGGASTGIEMALGRHGLSYTPEYRAWQTARLRCTSPTAKAYANYGGRGIRMCDRWLNNPAAFLADMGKKPSPVHELDRINNDGHYEPGNCRWVLRKVNDRNRRSNLRLTFMGETHALAEWCERMKLPRDTVHKRLKSGWAVDAALTTPVRSKAPNGAGRRDGRESAAIVGAQFAEQARRMQA
jgi:hypothetical protein